MKIEFSEVHADSECDLRSESRFTGRGGRVTFQLDDGKNYLGTVINESFGGAGIIFDDRIPVSKSAEIEVTYHGVPTMAIVRHVSAFNKGGCMVGVHWKAAAIKAQVAELREVADRRDLNLPDALERFIELLPGGVELMQQLAQNERWPELSEAIDRLSRDAMSAGVYGSNDCLDVLMHLVEDAPNKAHLLNAIDDLVEQYIEKTTEVALKHKLFE